MADESKPNAPRIGGEDPALALARNIRPLAPLSFRKPAKPPLKQAFRKAARRKPPKRARYDKEGYTPLLRAVFDGDVKAVCRLLKEGHDPNQCSKSGYSALHAVAQNGNFAIAEALLKAGAQVGEDALHISINYSIGHFRTVPPVQRVDFLLVDAWVAQGGPVSTLSHQMHNAAHGGDPALVRKLASCGADINHRREWGRAYTLEKGEMTPVMCAIGGYGDEFATVSEMLQLGANAQEALGYARRRQRYGDEPLETTRLGVLLAEAASGKKLPSPEEAGSAAHENLVGDMLRNPPPGLKYSGRRIDRNAVEAHLRRRR
jgi:hypothetical protein